MVMQTPVSAERLHISFFGLRNAGKSSLVNAVTSQNLSIVSNIKGTTTDPVKKAMELKPLGPVVIIDTPGFDDEGELGNLRVAKTMQILSQTDIAILVTDATKTLSCKEKDIIKLFTQKNINYVIAKNKCDLLDNIKETDSNEIFVSAATGKNIFELKERIGAFAKNAKQNYLVSDLISRGDIVILVVPIDSASPKGRLILPQQQTIREILDCGAMPIICRDEEFLKTLQALSQKPKLIITDSQVFEKIKKQTPDDYLLTSFSILFARYKGNLKSAVEGAKKIDLLQEGDKVLISEGCTHHRQCEDIGTVKIPKWISDYTKKTIHFDFTSGTEFPQDVTKYALVIHCGACMLNEREVKSRHQTAISQNVPVTNYGIAIAHINGILKRVLQPFKEFSES